MGRCGGGGVVEGECDRLEGRGKRRVGSELDLLDGHDADARQQTHEDPQLPELELGEEGETGDV